MRCSSSRRRWSAVVALLLSSLNCSGDAAVDPTPPDGVATDARVASGVTGRLPGEMSDVDTGLTFRLGEGEVGAESRQAPRRVDAEQLSPEQTAALLARLPTFEGEAGDEQSFALRERSLPPPRTGATVVSAFPPVAHRPPVDPVDGGPLTVARRMPEGDVPLAPHLTVTFSQPMVAVTSQEEAKRTRPVTLTPEPAGAWRWLGTKTIVFEPAAFADQKGGNGRFPKATRFDVAIPGGTRSATGGELAEPVTWSFTTPAPTVARSWPFGGSTPQRLDPLMFIELDQRIDPTAVLATIQLEAGELRSELRLATDHEIAADREVARMAKAAEPGRWLAFRATDRLPPATTIRLTIGPGTPSTEGPLTTTEAQKLSFTTYGPMVVKWQSCTKGQQCPPGYPLSVHFSNPIDEDAFAAAAPLAVTPEIPAMKQQVSGQSLTIQGATKGRATYRVTLPADLRDVFGQTLGTDQVLEFTTTDAGKQLFARGGQFQVLDPASTPKLSVFSINHDKLRVKLFAVTPNDWDGFFDYVRNVFQRDVDPPDPPGRPVSNEIISVGGVRDELTETRVDFAAALSGELGSVIVVVEPTERPKERWQWRPIVTWVQVTHIGLDAFVDDDDLLAWATGLGDAAPLADVALTIVPGGVTGRTAADGLATLPLSRSEAGRMLVARRGDDVAFLPESVYMWGGQGGWKKQDSSDSLRWYIADDRQIYRPGEQVRIKGWLRYVGGGELGDVMGLDGRVTRVTYAVRDQLGNEIATGDASVSSAGGFDTSFVLPATANLGHATLAFVAEPAGGQGHHSIRVEEFRRPEFEVDASLLSAGPFVIGARAVVAVDASYYAGGGLANADTTWQVTATPTDYSPPNRDGYTFGPQRSWWDHFGPRGDVAIRSETLRGRTDPAGRHLLGVEFLAVHPARASRVVAQATVMDVNRQAWSASATMIVHAAERYVGLKLPRPYVAAGETIRVQAIACDIDGALQSGQAIAMRAVRLDWGFVRGEYVEQEVDDQSCTVASGDDAVECTFTPRAGGLHRITASVTDGEGRDNISQILVWVAGGKLPPQRDVAQETVRMLADKSVYAVGDTAEIALIPPFYPAEGLVTYRRSGIFHSERFRVDGPSHVLRVPIEEAWTPNMTVQVDLVGSAPRTDDEGNVIASLPPRPAYAMGAVELSIPPLTRALSVAAKPRQAKLEPGGETSLDISLTDATGQPVAGAEVAVVVVDESVLALADDYRLPDPLTIFYSHRPAGGRDYHLRESVQLGRPDDLGDGGQGADFGRPEEEMYGGLEGAMAPEMMMSADAPPPMARAMRASAPGGGGEPSAPSVIRERTDFDALAVFAPSVATDDDGNATVAVKLPDNLTRYRVMVVAVAGDRLFGRGEAVITARLPLMVRASPPRFLNFGDHFELPVVVQNQTDDALSVDVAVRATNAELTAGAGRRLTVPANDRVEVRFPAAAARAGTARFQVGAASGAWADASRFDLPVWTPATTEAFATYGTIDDGAIAQPIQYPAGVVAEFGGLEVTTSSTALQALTDALLYLVAYPYECSEQVASRILAVAALRDVLTAFDAEGLPSAAAIEATVAKDIETLRRLQNDDGGWGFWKRNEESWPFLSIHVAHALARARAKGYDVPDVMITRATNYMEQMEPRLPAWWSLDVKRSCRAYALYTLAQLGRPNTGKAAALIDEAGGVGQLPIEAVGWIYPVLSGDAESTAHVEAIRRFFASRVEETAAAAHFVTNYADGGYLLLHSERRVDAIVLEGMIGDQPQSDLIPKLVEGLLAHRTAGRWANTQESTWVLLALDRYFNTYEKTTPDFTARVWLGERYAGDHEFQGRTTERAHIDVPMSYLAELPSGGADLTIDKDGAGRLYYRVGMRYAPADLQLPAADYGFTVERTYEAVDDSSDVERAADGGWRIKAGARVRVRLTMLAPSRRYHVALVDPLPAGLEPLNPTLATTGKLPADPNDAKGQVGGGRYWWWWRPWFTHQNLRDERVEAFTSLLWEGVHTYTYVARATTPGAFVVPPTKAEEMYHPEVFGRSAGDRVTVVE